MLAPKAFCLTLFSSVATLASAYYPQGSITSPANGTAIQPGQPFNFTYHTRGDYCTSSFNYTVYLLTTDPATARLGDENVFGYGEFIGRYTSSSIGSC
jgi:hypothetical protein